MESEYWLLVGARIVHGFAVEMGWVGDSRALRPQWRLRVSPRTAAEGHPVIITQRTITSISGAEQRFLSTTSSGLQGRRPHPRTSKVGTAGLKTQMMGRPLCCTDAEADTRRGKVEGSGNYCE